MNSFQVCRKSLKTFPLLLILLNAFYRLQDQVLDGKIKDIILFPYNGREISS